MLLHRSASRHEHLNRLFTVCVNVVCVCMNGVNINLRCLPNNQFMGMLNVWACKGTNLVSNTWAIIVLWTNSANDFARSSSLNCGLKLVYLSWRRVTISLTFICCWLDRWCSKNYTAQNYYLFCYEPQFNNQKSLYLRPNQKKACVMHVHFYLYYYF